MLKKIWIPMLIVLLTGIVGLLYSQKGTDQAPIKVFKPTTVDPSTQTKPPPPGETAESGHWKPGDEWHAEPHDSLAPVEVSEADAELVTPSAERTEVQGTPVGAPPVNVQTGILEQEAYKSTQEERDFQRALKEWGDRLSQLSEESSRAGRAHTALSPGTEEELERYKADPEWQRKLNEALSEAAKASAMVDAHMKEMPVRP